MSPSAERDPLTPPTCAPDLVAALAATGQTVASAESLTAGLFAATLAGVPGASAVLRGGVIVYATELKAQLAGVPQEVLDRDGPVAPTTARALAAGVRERCAATWGIGLTGVAGPDPQDGRPVGTVYIGIAGPEGTDVVELAAQGDRWAIRSGTTRRALSELLDRVRGQGGADADLEPPG
ncbi:CinA family protein [Rhodococcus sp. D2-41]|uniref:CinA family protein n=1 Tax=Speluncibacter jeojiensis TaxID=2710754 RepID=UPI0024102021|nr:CinA family protein [Rhodococcus sp. D2-41]MDG3010912.1 CinA family protein [Rhodococcus sp. D2-41]